MSTMYKCKDRVSYSRIDTEGKLKVYAIVNAMQDCSLFHSEDVGLSCMDLKSEDAHAWLVNSWDIVIKRRPIMGEVFEVSTWPYKMRGVFGMRNFVMKTEEGETLAYADSHWFFFDQKTGTPVKPEPEDYEAYGMEEPYPMEYKYVWQPTTCHLVLKWKSSVSNTVWLRNLAMKYNVIHVNRKRDFMSL